MNHLSFLTVALILFSQFANAQYNEEWARNMGRYVPNASLESKFSTFTSTGKTVTVVNVPFTFTVPFFLGNTDMVEVYDINGQSEYIGTFPAISQSVYFFHEATNKLFSYDKVFKTISSLDLVDNSFNTKTVTSLPGHGMQDQSFFHDHYITLFSRVQGQGYKISQIDTNAAVVWSVSLNSSYTYAWMKQLPDNSFLIQDGLQYNDTLIAYHISTSGVLQTLGKWYIPPYPSNYKNILNDNQGNLYYLSAVDSVVNNMDLTYNTITKFSGTNTAQIEWSTSLLTDYFWPAEIYIDSNGSSNFFGQSFTTSTSLSLFGLEYLSISSSGTILQNYKLQPTLGQALFPFKTYANANGTYTWIYTAGDSSASTNYPIANSYSFVTIDPNGSWVAGPMEVLDNTYSSTLTTTMDSSENIYVSVSAKGYAPPYSGYNFTKKYCANLCGSTIIGTVYNDADNNCQKTVGESTIANRIVELLPGQTYNVTNSAGEFSFSKPTGTYSIHQILPRHWNASCAEPLAVTVTSPSLQSQIDLGSYITPNVTDGSVTLTSTTAILGVSHNNLLTYRNVGSNPISGTLVFEPDSNLVVTNSNVAPASTNGNILTWNVTNLLPGQSVTINLTAEANFIVPLGYGLLVQNHARFNIVGDVYPQDNEAMDYNSIFNWGVFKTDLDSFFANAFIDVQPSGLATDGKIGINDTILEYTIRLWNKTGRTISDGKVQVNIDSNLYLPSLSILGSSHPVEIAAIDKNSLIFHFQDMQLSSNNEPTLGSVAVIKYQVKTKRQLPLGTQISASAVVLLDYDALYLTNKITSTVSTISAINETDLGNSSIMLYPNPSSNKIVIKFDSATTAAISIHDVTGKEVIAIPSYETNTQINVEMLADGMYFVKATIAGEVIALKFLKQ